MAPDSGINVIEMVTQSRPEDLLFPDANSFLSPLDTEERCFFQPTNTCLKPHVSRVVTKDSLVEVCNVNH
jgi:hypothetical protein